MSPTIIIVIILIYFSALIAISYFTSKNSDSDTFFLGNKNSPWYIVAFGMIGSSLSGVTFISVPGWVGASQFSYMQVVFGYLVGYFIIATLLLPLYYRLNLTSIYTYLNGRFGVYSYKTGAWLFLVSRTIGASFRLYLVTIVLQVGVFDKLGMHVPFIVTVAITILLIWVYTFKSGIKTIIWTDTFQTFFLISALFITIYVISNKMNLNIVELFETIKNSPYSKMFFFDDVNDTKYFYKQFLSGIFIAIAMTGLDQDMMQKNLTCRNLKDAQKNMFSFSILLVFVNFVFLALGALLFIYSNQLGIAIPEKTDTLYPMLAMDGFLGPVAAIFFVLGLIAASYASADAALAALTTSYCIDIIGIEKFDEAKRLRIRNKVHIAMSLVLAILIIVFKVLNNESVIKQIFTIAGYTYGPLLGLYAFGLFSKRKVIDKLVPFICIASPIICYILNIYSEQLFNGYKFSFELLIMNGMITYFGIWLTSLRITIYLFKIKIN
jgi:solute:Na+ symporter, SSS family